MLALSWVGDRFEAVAVQRGSVTGSWSATEPVRNLDEFAATVREAKSRTGYAGSVASLVLAQPRLGQQPCQAPPADGTAMKRVVQRLVDRQKLFEDEAAWSYLRTVPTKTSDNILLFLYPRALLERMVGACRRAGLNLERVMPCTAVLLRLLADLPIGPEEVTLLAGEAGGQTAIVVGRGDGQVLLGRLLEVTWNLNHSELVLEFNRTNLFVNQQFWATVTGIHLIGTGAAEKLAALQADLSLPVNVVTEADDTFSWARASLRVPPNADANLVPREQRHAPQRRFLCRATSVVVVLLVISSLGTALYLQILVKEERRSLQHSLTRRGQLQQQQEQLRTQYLDLEHQRDYVKGVEDGRVPPMPVWLLGYLGQALPTDLALTNFSVVKKTECWEVRLGGISRAGATAAVVELTNAFWKGPFHGTLAAGAAGEHSLRNAPGSSLLARYTLQRRPDPAAPSSVAQPFYLEGAVR